MNRGRHNNDVFIKKTSLYVQNKTSYRTYISDFFSILITNRMTQFCNLFVKQPS